MTSEEYLAGVHGLMVFSIVQEGVDRN